VQRKRVNGLCGGGQSIAWLRMNADVSKAKASAFAYDAGMRSQYLVIRNPHG
jgi:hypothetical protein